MVEAREARITYANIAAEMVKWLHEAVSDIKVVVFRIVQTVGKRCSLDQPQAR